MIANEANQLSLQVRNQLLGEKENTWLILSKYIFHSIEASALGGNFEITLDMKNKYFRESYKIDFEFIKNKLESKGYSIEYRIERSPNGKREIVINWKYV